MRTRLKLAALLGILAGAFFGLTVASAHTASGDGSDDWSHAQAVIPGDPCGHVGDKGVHWGPNGLDHYKCLQKWAASCPHWMWVYNPETPKSGKTAWPRPSCPCSSTSASPSSSTSASPTPIPAPTASPSLAVTPAPSNSTTAPAPVHSTAVAATGGGSLPVTGSPVVALGSLGGAFVAVGGLILFALRVRRAARP